MGVALVVASIAALAMWLFGCAVTASPPAGSVSVGLGGESASWSRDGSLIAAPGWGGDPAPQSQRFSRARARGSRHPALGLAV